MRSHLYLLSLVTAFLVACGGGGSELATPPTSPILSATPQKIEIIQGAGLLTQPNQSVTLAVRVLDSAGRELAIPVVWESSKPAHMAISSAGTLSAASTGGVSQITARIGALRSAPMLAVHTQVPAQTVLVNDAQILGEPQETTPGAAPSITNTYSVRLSGIAAPAVGELIINTGGKIVVGRATAVQSADGIHLVTLRLVPMREAFPSLVIDEVFDLSRVEPIFPAEIAQTYDIARDGDTYRFTPKAGLAVPASVLTSSPKASAANKAVANGKSQRELQAAASGTFALPPFKKCEFTAEGAGGAGSLPVKLSKIPSYVLTFKPQLHTKYTPENGLERMVVSTDAIFTADTSLEIVSGFDAKFTCTIELLVLRIPVGGPVAAFISGLVTLGAGFEASLKTSLPGIKITNTYERKNTLELGVACAPGCSLVNTLSEPIVKSTAAILAPDFNDLRFEPSLYGYGLAQLAIGNPLFTSLRFNAFYGKLGVAAQISYANREAQIASPSYQSSYQLAALFKAGIESDFGKLAALLGFNGAAENLIEVNKPMATSPAGTLTVAKASFKAGDEVETSVELDPASTRFLSIYNIDAVVIVRKIGSAPLSVVARLSPVTEGQTRLTIPFTAASDGSADELHAFVVPKVPFFATELSKAAVPVAAVSQRLSAGGAHTCALSSAGGVKCWGSGFEGQLGNDSLNGRFIPVNVVGLGDEISAITSGDLHSCALDGSGGVKCWGSSRLTGSGIINNGRSAPVDVVGLRSGVVSIDAGRSYTCALTNAGGVKCWGANFAAQLGNNSTDDSLVPVDVVGLSSGVIAISAGGDHTCALTSSGSVKCWGSNFSGQLGNNTKVDSLVPVDVVGISGDAVAISVGGSHTCALTKAGGVMCWGYNSLGQLGNNTTNSSIPVGVRGLGSDIAAITTGASHSCALTRTGAVKCWGSNNDLGQFFGSSNTGSFVPVDVEGLNSGVAAISAGNSHTCVLTNVGGIKCWGYNESGQLGNNTNTNSTTPVNVVGFP